MSLIYSIEDDLNIQHVIRIALTNSGYEFEAFSDAPSAFARLQTRTPSMFLLDIMLPGLDGIGIIRQLKSHSEWSKIPILVISAKTSEIDKVIGLDTGADDYLSKPFGVLELISRVKALLRRTEPADSEPTWEMGGLVLDTKEHTCRHGEVEITLTAKEFSLLKELMKSANKVLTREELMNNVWGYDFIGESRTLDVHIKELRQKLLSAGLPDGLIETIRGVGYKFRP